MATSRKAMLGLLTDWLVLGASLVISDTRMTTRQERALKRLIRHTKPFVAIKRPRASGGNER